MEKNREVDNLGGKPKEHEEEEIWKNNQPFSRNSKIYKPTQKSENGWEETIKITRIKIYLSNLQRKSPKLKQWQNLLGST